MIHRLSLVAMTLVALFGLPPASGDAQAAPAADLVDTAIAAGNFSTLVTAVQAADLVDTLKGEGPFTVFAPTDAAFAALPEGTLDTLLANPDQLRDVLLYHVVSGKLMAADVAELASAETVQGGHVAITHQDGEVRVNSARVVTADVEASNGVIHVIDAVLIPEED